MRALSKRQTDVLTFLREYALAHGYGPTYREIAAHLGIRSTNGVAEHIQALVRKGYVDRGEPGRARASVPRLGAPKCPHCGSTLQ